ncbi:MAG TPA: arylformamidase [Caulobacteraceae bacterium]|jgi:arylformamidase
MNRIWDISQTLRPGLPVWPGDTPFSAGRRWSQGEDSPVTVSRFETTVHAGTHADAPLHYAVGEADAAGVELDAYVGPCRLIDARDQGPAIGAVFVQRAVTAPPPRVLFRTYERFPHEAWSSDFTAIEAGAIAALAALGVKLVGLDSPSLDPQDSKTMDAHKAVLAAGMRVLEGLVLDDVPPGDYELIALPLKLAGLDASPVRAVLRSLGA